MDLTDTIAPKSDQINADDLITGSITVTVAAVKRGTPDQPVSIVLEGKHQPYKPCKSMRRVLIALWGKDGAAWVGRKMTLFCDPSVTFGGVALGGIRISHLSGIDAAKTMMLTRSRSKRAAWTVLPLTLEKAADSYPDDKFKANLQAWAAVISKGGMTLNEVVKKAGNAGGKMTEQQILELEDAVVATKKETT